MTLSRTTKSFSQNRSDDISFALFQESSMDNNEPSQQVNAATSGFGLRVICTRFIKIYEGLCFCTLQLDSIATAFQSNHLSSVLLKGCCFRISFRAGRASGKLHAAPIQPTFTLTCLPHQEPPPGPLSVHANPLLLLTQLRPSTHYNTTNPDKHTGPCSITCPSLRQQAKTTRYTP